MNELRIKIDRLASAIEGLAQHGPLKLEALRGLSTPECIQPAIDMLSESDKKYANPQPHGGQRLCPDKTGYRIGIAPEEAISKRMMDEAANAKNAIHARNVEMKKNLVQKD